jgi:hypothetical protein
MPDTSTEVALATTTLSSAAASITFSSISGSYKDLRLVLVTRDAGAGGILQLTFNGSSATNYSDSWIRGNGSTASGGRNTTQAYINMQYATGGATNWGMFTADIFNYSGSTNKTVLLTDSNDENGSGFVYRQVGLWRSTAAITSLTVTANSGTMAAGTTATIYGIL